ncbi:hypothetical protein LIER_42627 [Lithospermum erythrorhizon]|uniref:Uncharacterized protein n=1 Tax=Lithospermum erythrorhizon TaxID=34254 RepID=A0AAV3NN37_LITER
MALSILSASTTMIINHTTGKLNKSQSQAVRALPIRILSVGKKRSPGVQLIVDEYIGKLRHYCPVDDIRVKSNPRNARLVVRVKILYFLAHGYNEINRNGSL